MMRLLKKGIEILYILCKTFINYIIIISGNGIKFKSITTVNGFELFSHILTFTYLGPNTAYCTTMFSD